MSGFLLDTNAPSELTRLGDERCLSRQFTFIACGCRMGRSEQAASQVANVVDGAHAVLRAEAAVEDELKT